ncbi:hypothetical protein AO738_04500 [Pseudomonas citronellolis]|nr:hypothetical protein AO742_26525 [Pseudomonas citronellolis]KRW77502.1 hypothetical protein AO738_04500 [Pseudomonas citronellolis]
MIPIDYRTKPLIDVRREELAGQVEQYLASGHIIQSIPTGVSGEKDAQWNNRARALSKAKPGQTDAAHAKFEENKREKRRLLAQTVRYCAEQGMSISATADAMDLNRATVRKIAREFGIKF